MTFRQEILWVSFAGVAGGAIRGHQIHQVGLSHFDAGVYAQSALWPWTGSLHFQQGYFSPPLFPILEGLVNAGAGQPIDFAGSLVSVILGTLLIPVSWWLARTWHSPAAGVVTAWLVALSGFQILFSRIGLTDATFATLFWAGFTLGIRAIEREGWGRILGTGLVIGLAWNTKYNGFLPIALLVPLALLADPRQRLPRWAATATLAGFMYLPWAAWFHVKQGYASLIEHQRGYLMGWAGILPNLSEAVGEFRIVESPLLAAGLCVALCVGLRARATIPFMAWSIVGSAWIMLDQVWTANLLTLVALACVGIWSIQDQARRWCALWAVAVLVLLPAMYTPYLRLWLPTDTLLLVLAAGGLVQITSVSGSEARGVTWPRVAWGSLLAVAVGLANLVSWPTLGVNGRLRDWYESSYWPVPGYREVAGEIASQLPADAVVYTFCRWPMNYYLAAHSLQVRPLSGEPIDGAMLGPNDFLVVDVAVRDTPRFAESLDRMDPDFEVRSFDGFEADQITRLDDDHAGDSQPVDYTVRVYRRP